MDHSSLAQRPAYEFCGIVKGDHLHMARFRHEQGVVSVPFGAVGHSLCEAAYKTMRLYYLLKAQEENQARTGEPIDFEDAVQIADQDEEFFSAATDAGFYRDILLQIGNELGTKAIVTDDKGQSVEVDAKELAALVMNNAARLSWCQITIDFHSGDNSRESLDKLHAKNMRRYELIEKRNGYVESIGKMGRLVMA